jgi:DNA-binding response OmpR family regulator
MNIGITDTGRNLGSDANDSMIYPEAVARVISSTPMPAMEAALLRYFREHQGRIITREELAENVWKRRYFYGSRAIDRTVSSLRKKLGRGEEKILSIYSAGYQFTSGNSVGSSSVKRGGQYNGNSKQS